MAEPIEALRRVPLFAGLGDRELRSIAGSMTQRSYPQGSAVMTEEENGIGFFVIVEGDTTVSVRGEPKTRLGPGDFFGETALIEGETRTATITADTDLRCLVMTAWNFRPFVKANPDVAWGLLETLVRRLREAGR